MDSVPHIKAKGMSISGPVRSTKTYNVYDIEISGVNPVTNDVLTIQVHFFENKKEGRLPLLILVPPINGVSSREKKVSEHFIKEGYHTLIIEPVRNISNNDVPIVEFQKNILCFISAVRSAVDVFEQKEQIDPKNIFIWAASMGAIYSSIVISIDNRINAAVLIVGGTSIADIVTDSKQRHVVKYKKERIKCESLASIEDFRLKLQESVHIDVPNFAKNRKASDLFFVVALKDKSVPTCYQLNLVNAFGEGSTVTQYNCGHARALLQSHFLNLAKFSNFTNSKLIH
jgi:dienelactone hydrolase